MNWSNLRETGRSVQLQATDMGFLRKVRGVKLRDKVRTCEIRKVLNV